MEQKNDTAQTEQAENQAPDEPKTDVIRPVTRPKSRGDKRPLLIVALLIAAGLMGFAGSWAQDYLKSGTQQTTVLNTSKQDGNNVVTPNEESIAAVAKAVSPSVVSILTTSSQVNQLFNQQYQQEGAGTGMIVSSNGYIMTNKHVIDGADKVTVVLPNGKTYENVSVLGSDPLNDVAFLKINNVSGLPAIVMGDSKTIRIGQSVVAIGNALGQYQNTVTSGIVSGTGRPVTASSNGAANGSTENLTDLIQTDAAINSGNSGGPLLNLKGQVIGINTAIAQDAQSIGFAIPISATKGLLAHVIKTGKVERAYLGVQYMPLTPALKDQYHLSVDRGDYITADRGSSVQANGPAAKAGLKDGDVITQVNGFNVGEVASVSSLISEYEPGQSVQLTVVRGDKTLTLNATLGTYQS